MKSWSGVFLDIERRIHAVYILLVQLFPELLHAFSKPLKMDDFPLTQEFNDIVYIRVVRKSQDVIIGHPGLLLWERIA